MKKITIDNFFSLGACSRPMCLLQGCDFDLNLLIIQNPRNCFCNIFLNLMLPPTANSNKKSDIDSHKFPMCEMLLEQVKVEFTTQRSNKPLTFQSRYEAQCLLCQRRSFDNTTESIPHHSHPHSNPPSSWDMQSDKTSRFCLYIESIKTSKINKKNLNFNHLKCK